MVGSKDVDDGAVDHISDLLLSFGGILYLQDLLSGLVELQTHGRRVLLRRLLHEHLLRNLLLRRLLLLLLIGRHHSLRVWLRGRHLLHHVLRRSTTYLTPLVHTRRHWLRLGHGHGVLGVAELVMVHLVLRRHHSTLSTSVVLLAHAVIELATLVVLVGEHLLLLLLLLLTTTAKHLTKLVRELLAALGTAVLHDEVGQLTDLAEILLLLLLLDLILGHPELDSDWPASEDVGVVELLDGELGFLHLLKENVAVLVSRDLHILDFFG